MTVTAAQVRLIVGLGADVIPDAAVEAAIQLATAWCENCAGAYHVSAPDCAVMDMTVYYLRQHLDMAGVKPSSISLPGITMATDLASACRLLMESAEGAIKKEAAGKGASFRHIRSGKVGRWH